MAELFDGDSGDRILEDLRKIIQDTSCCMSHVLRLTYRSFTDVDAQPPVKPR